MNSTPVDVPLCAPKIGQQESQFDSSQVEFESSEPQSENDHLLSAQNTVNPRVPERFTSLPLQEFLATPILQEQLNIAKVLMPHWYKPKLSKTEAAEYLHDKDLGWFIVRDSVSVQGGYSLAIRTSSTRKIPEGQYINRVKQIYIAL